MFQLPHSITLLPVYPLWIRFEIGPDLRSGTLDSLESSDCSPRGRLQTKSSKQEILDRLAEGVVTGSPLVYAKIGLDDPLNRLGDVLVECQR